MEYDIEIRDTALEDLEKLPKKVKQRMVRAIEQRLIKAPDHYGTRLRRSLYPYWKIRVGDYRIVYEFNGTFITVWAIAHRKKIYEFMKKRLF